LNSNKNSTIKEAKGILNKLGPKGMDIDLREFYRGL